MNSPAEIVLNDEHQYFVDGRPVPGVTEVIRHFAQSWQADKWHLQRGRAVHKAVELALAWRLDMASVDERIKGRVEGIMAFLASQQLIRITSEMRLYSNRYNFCGTLDYVGAEILSALATRDHIIADWKASPCPADEIQIGAYALLWNDQGYKIDSEVGRAVIVQSFDDGTFKVRWLNKRQIERASKIFLNMLSVYQWKGANGYVD